MNHTGGHLRETVSDAGLLLRVLRDRRCDGVSPESRLAEPRLVEGILMIALVNTGHAGPSDRVSLARAPDHTAGLLAGEGGRIGSARPGP